MRKILLTICLVTGMLLSVSTIDAKEKEFKDVNTPIFGVVLGQPIKNLNKSFIVKDLGFIDGSEKVEKVYILENDPNSNIIPDTVKYIVVRTCVPVEERISSIGILFKDFSDSNYDAIKGALKKKYPSTSWEEEDIINKEFKGTLRINHVPVFCSLNLKFKLIENNELRLEYSHYPLCIYIINEVQKRKAEKVENLL